MAELRQITPREYSSLTPGSKFPLTGPGVRDNGSIWFRGLFGALGAALAACGKSGTQISHLKVNHDDLFGVCEGTTALRAALRSNLRVGRSCCPPQRPRRPSWKTLTADL